MDSDHEGGGNPQARRPRPGELDQFRRVIQQHTGLHFDDWRLPTLERALWARMSANGIASIASYLKLLQGSEQRLEELSALLEQITVNETFFFRYPRQYDYLRETLFAPLHNQPRLKSAPLRIWSAGCASGEEAYSIAMVALDTLGPVSEQALQIIATDVSASSLAAAQQAEYSRRSLRLLDQACQARYFRRVADNRFLLVDDVRRLVLFRRSHLLDDVKLAVGSFDAIFCRNVLIYFTLDVVERVLDGLYHCLKEDGYLFVGHSEVVKHKGFSLCHLGDALVFQKAVAQPKTPVREPIKVVSRAAAASSSNSVACTGSRGASDDLFEAALEAFEREEYLHAKERLDHLLYSFPHHLGATLLRANASLNLGRHEQALKECEEALQLDSQSAEAHTLHGMSYLKLSQPALAVAALRKACYLAPKSCVVQLQLGHALRAEKMLGPAQRAFQSALALLPQASEPDLRRYLGGFSKPALEMLLKGMIAECHTLPDAAG
jgi:chemotaxis protein methyltransferase CheR